MKIMNKLAVVFVTLLLSACASKPQVEFDAEKMSSIKTIAVGVPKPIKYFAVTSGGPVFIPIPGVGLLAAAVGGVVAGSVAAASTRSNKDFDSLVKDRLGDTGLNRRYVEAIENELRAQGYQVKEINLGQDGMPEIAGDAMHPVLKGKPYAGADAIMIVPAVAGYGANGVGCPYVRTVNSRIRIFTSNNFDTVFSQNFFYMATCQVDSGINRGVFENMNANRDIKKPDPYSYQFYSDLVADLPHAIQGVDEKLMSLVPQFRTALLSSRGLSESIDANQK